MAWEITITDGETKTDPLLAETPENIAAALSGIAAALQVVQPTGYVEIKIWDVGELA